MEYSNNDLNDLGRRTFLKQVAGAGLAVGVGPWLASCGFSSGSDASPASKKTELRTHYFDLSNADQSHDFYLVAGKNHHPLSLITGAQLGNAGAVNSRVPGGSITHTATVALPANDIQLLYVKGVSRAAGQALGAWTMHHAYFHIPLASSTKVGKALAACNKSPDGSRNLAGIGSSLEKIALAGLGIGEAHADTATPYSYCTDPNNANLVDYFAQAMTLICHHPEILSFDPDTLSYVQQNIICADANTLALAVSLYQQGPATTIGYGPDGVTWDSDGGWAQLVAVKDPVTGDPVYETGMSYVDPITGQTYEGLPTTQSCTDANGNQQTCYVDPLTGQPSYDQNGNPLPVPSATVGNQKYIAMNSPTTLQLTGAAIRSVLRTLKNDHVLGANITGLQPDAGTADAPGNTQLKGKLWAVRNGTPTRTASTLSAGTASALSTRKTGLRSSSLAVAGATSFAARDCSSFFGYEINSITGTTGRTVSFQAQNSFVRYLGLYIRFLDGAGNPITYASLSSTVQNQFNSTHSGTYDCFLGIVTQELVLFGVPLWTYSTTYTFTLPDNAVSFKILAGGIGIGEIKYPETLNPAAALTAVFDYVIPTIFMAMGASSFFGKWSTAQKIGAAIIQEIYLAEADAGFFAAGYGNYKWMNLVTAAAINIGKICGPTLAASLAAYINGGKALDSSPLVGQVIFAVTTAATLVQMGETTANIAKSPHTYDTTVLATHDLTVTINHDPKNVAGFPATATHYRIYATPAGCSTTDSGAIDMPATAQTAPLSKTLPGLQSGGTVDIKVIFYSDSGWLCGTGSVNNVDNTLDAATVTITEVLVPLTSTTQYGHKQKITLDASGNHVWTATSAPPFVHTSCDAGSGNLCKLAGITLSEPFGAIGYAWQAYSSGVRDFASGGSAQLYQFANLAFTQTPQTGYMSSGGGFSSPALLAYDPSKPTSNSYYIDSSGGATSNIVRQITMAAIANGDGQPPTFDAPTSNRAVGMFNYTSNALLVHSTGKLISINTQYHIIEVLTPADTPLADSDPLLPVAVTLGGQGSRAGLLNAPICMALSHGGAILIIESGNNRVQAFDTGGNPAYNYPYCADFPNIDPTNTTTSPFFSLNPARNGSTYMDMVVESVGYLYVLSVNSTNVYTLDIYDQHGAWVSATSGVNAGKLTVDLFRNLYTLNYETLKLPSGTVPSITEPSISQWIPSTPTCTPAMVTAGTCVTT